MNTSDVTNLILILVCYGLLLSYNHYLIQSGLVKRNFEQYKCNPAFIPFAQHYGYDPQKLMYQCIQDIQTEEMPKHLEPVTKSINNLENKANTSSDETAKTQKDMGGLRSDMLENAKKIFGAFNNIIIEFQKLIQIIKTWAAKMIAMMSVLLYFFEGTMVYTLPSAGNSPLGQVMVGLCFHPDTKMKLNNGTYVKMKDIEIGQKIKNGSVVCATMKIKNFDGDGNTLEGFYKLPNGEDNESIYVTGSHLVFDNSQKTFVQVKDYKDAVPCDIQSKWFTCLITSDHLMVVGKNVFHDWEDNNGSVSKNLV